MTAADRQAAQAMAARAADWRDGAIVYQAFVDRFAPSANLAAKRKLYDSPRSLHDWREAPVGGSPVPALGLWSHELAFWGGDLKSVEGKLDYVHSLGADVMYLNPIVPSLTNHKYDAQDWAEVAPEYGTRQDVVDLANGLHRRGMRLMLDGAFNHMGRSAPKFQSALNDPKSPYRNWFFIGSNYAGGYRAWNNVGNLPEARLENPEVQKYIWAAPDSVVQKYLRDGVDGWRLDTAYELGPRLLGELTEAAHHAKPGSVVVGEAWNYPAGWFPALDGIMNFYARAVVLDLLSNKLTALEGNKMLARMVSDAGIDHLLKSWMILDNHDTSRLKSLLPDDKKRRLAQILQFALPGCPVIYYGAELGMEGAGDPGSRGPMRWDLAVDSNPELQWMRKLIELRKSHPALRYGDYVGLDTDRLVGFIRKTDKVLDTVIVLVNPSSEPVTESVTCRDGRIMSGNQLRDMIGGSTVRPFSGLIDVTLPAWSARIYELVRGRGYTPYKRIH